MSEMSQEEIDALLGGGSSTPSTADDGGDMNQADIDAMLAGGGSTPPSDDHFGGEDSGLDDDMAALLAEIQSDPNVSTDQGEVNIDELLTEISPDSALSGGESINQSDIQSLIESVHDPSEAADVELAEEEPGVNVDFLLDMQLELTFEVGRSKMMISDLLSLGQGSVIELHRLVGEDLDLFVAGKLVAKGEVVVVNEKFGVRILDIVPPTQRIKLMSGMDQLT